MSLTDDYSKYGFPNGAYIAEDDYTPLMGPINCPQVCLTDYARPYNNFSCPSACNNYEQYKKVTSIYNAYQPARANPRIYPAKEEFRFVSPSNIDDSKIAFQVGMSTQNLMQKIDQLQKLIDSLKAQVQSSLINAHSAEASKSAEHSYISAQKAQEANATASQIVDVAKKVGELGKMVPATPSVVSAVNQSQALAEQAVGLAQNASEASKSVEKFRFFGRK